MKIGLWVREFFQDKDLVFKNFVFNKKISHTVDFYAIYHVHRNQPPVWELNTRADIVLVITLRKIGSNLDHDENSEFSCNVHFI